MLGSILNPEITVFNSVPKQALASPSNFTLSKLGKTALTKLSRGQVQWE